MSLMKNILKQWVPSFVLALAVSLLVRTYVVEAMEVPSGSMLPTIQIHDRVVVEKLLRISKLEHGDLVVFHPPIPGQEDERFVKRLIGLPGDMIEVKDGSLYRNGEKVEEPYFSGRMNYSYGPVTVPEENYFFLGDNRNDSYDSHAWPTPFVKKEKLVGKVLVDIPLHVLY